MTVKIASLWPSLSMKILSINNFTTKLLSKLLSDLYIGVHLKGTKKFGSKVIDVVRVMHLNSTNLSECKHTSAQTIKSVDCHLSDQSHLMFYI